MISNSVVHDMLNLSRSMQQAIVKEERDGDEVIDATATFFILMRRQPTTPEIEARCLALMESGNVDLEATYTGNHTRILDAFLVDPHFCFEAIMRDPVYTRNNDDQQKKVFFTTASKNGWEKTLIKCFDTPEIRDVILKEGGWGYRIFSRDNVKLLEHLRDNFDVLTDEIKNQIASRDSTKRCFKMLLDEGWTPRPATLRQIAEKAEKQLSLVDALNKGIAAAPIYQTPLGVFRMSDLEERLEEIDSHWPIVQQVLHENVLELDDHDLVIAANKGDDALRQFMNPRFWRTMEERAHLTKLLEDAPKQITDRVKARQAILESSQEQNGWGRA